MIQGTSVSTNLHWNHRASAEVTKVGRPDVPFDMGQCHFKTTNGAYGQSRLTGPKSRCHRLTILIV